MKIAFGAISFTVGRFVEGETFMASDSAECTLVKITCEECHIRFQPGTLPTFINKYLMPYRVLKEKYEQLALF
ncbi:hypothetical protein ACFWMS_27480 [Peribacillus butanolivorans]|uniref:hypothetical protein n=1 Tax=Peribacillus butanolivorans TaxID=421767 RepID=UPI0036481358